MMPSSDAERSCYRQGYRDALDKIDRQLQADEYFTSASELYGQELGVHRGLWKAHDLIAAERRAQS